MTKKALVVDDSPTMCNMVSLALKEVGFEPATAGDGAIAVDMAEKEKYDLIVTDINMPNMDGIELIRYLREEGGYATTPILVLTTEAGDNAKAMGKKVGASGWMVKPFKPEILKAAAAKLCP